MSIRKIRRHLGRFSISLSLVLAGYTLVAVFPWPSSEPQKAAEVAGVGSVSNLQKTYEQWSKTTATGKLRQVDRLLNEIATIA